MLHESVKVTMVILSNDLCQLSLQWRCLRLITEPAAVVLGVLAAAEVRAVLGRVKNSQRIIILSFDLLAHELDEVDFLDEFERIHLIARLTLFVAVI
jgi:hypothetical protein